MLSLAPTLRGAAHRWSQWSRSTTPWRSCSTTIPHQTSETPSWAGADVEVAIHKSLDDMIPVDISRISGKIFNAPVRPDIVQQVVVWQLARRRAGTAKTKNRSEVAGSGRKIRPQKGTGRSRQGAITSPIFRGGGVVHGPRPRNYDYPLPNNVRMNGLRSMLSSKYANGQLWIVEAADVSGGRTENFVDLLDKYGWSSALVVDDVGGGPDGVTSSLYRATRFLDKSASLNAANLSVYDGMRHDKLILTTAAVRHLDETFAQCTWLY